MKKLIKKITVAIGAFVTMLYTKVLAYVMVGNDPEYGVPQPTYITMWEYARIIIIPIAFIIGAIIYFKKSKKETKNKIKTILIALVILVIAIFIVSFVIDFWYSVRQ